jgi:hypothetical protein
MELCKFSDNIVCPLDCIWCNYNFTLVGVVANVITEA